MLMSCMFRPVFTRRPVCLPEDWTDFLSLSSSTSPFMGRWGAGERGGGGSIGSEDIIPHCFPDLQGLYISLPTASYEAEATGRRL